MKKDQLVKGFFLAILAALMWGLSGTVAQFLFQEKGINVEWMITVRMLVSGFILLLFPLFQGDKDLWNVWKNRKDAFGLVSFSLVGMLTVQYTYFAAIKSSNAATATVLQYLGPIVIAMYLSIKERKLPSKIQGLSIALAMLGTFFLVTHGNIYSLSISGTALFWGVASAFSMAIYTLQPMKLLEKYSSSVIIGWGMLIGGIGFSFIKSPFAVEGIWDYSTYLYTFIIIIFGTLIAFYAYLSAAKIIGGQKTSLLASVEPLSAALLGIFWLNISFSPLDWLGSLLIVSTIALLSFKKNAV